jgi:DNA (cytosine-5)-methyltransferase 1
MLTVGSLFAGIGGFDLGLERAGMKVIWQSEIDPYASAVLKKHWPHVPNHGDIRTIRAGSVERPDVLCGGFPCQDISNAGKRAGIDGERSGLWSEYARLIGEIRPRYVIVENVAALLGRGLERVLGDLAALGFDAEWHCIPASAVGAPHRRDRLWIVANASIGRCGRADGGQVEQQGRTEIVRASEDDSNSERLRQLQPQRCERDERRRACNVCADVADANEPRLERWLRESLRECAGECVAWASSASPLADDDERGGQARGVQGHYEANEEWARRATCRSCWWRTEPDVGRVAHGIPARVDRLRCLGNAIVPQIAEIIGRAILKEAA